MRPTHRAYIAAAAATGAGAGLVALGQPGAGVALAAAGLGTGLLVTERSAPAERLVDACAGAVEGQAALAKALGLEGRAILVPRGPGLDEPRCFIPAKPATAEDLPPLDAATMIHRAPPGVLGLALPPAGLGLLRAWERASPVARGSGLEGAAVELRKALPGLELAAEPRVDRAGALARVRFRHTLLGDLCQWTRAAGAPWHLQGMCPTCSFAVTVVAEAMGRPVLVAEVAGDGARVELTLEVGASRPA